MSGQQSVDWLFVTTYALLALSLFAFQSNFSFSLVRCLVVVVAFCFSLIGSIFI